MPTCSQAWAFLAKQKIALLLSQALLWSAPARTTSVTGSPRKTAKGAVTFIQTERIMTKAASPTQLDLYSEIDDATDGAPLVQIRLVREIAHTLHPRTQVRSPEAIAAFLAERFADCATEEFVSINLNTANCLINVVTISRGGLAASIVEPRAVFQAAMLSNAAAVIVAHNHPSGNLEPSREDIRVTRQLAEAGRILGIPVHDHLVIAGQGFTSLAERGLMA